ncbi:heterocycloanthracin/sonorensin family bacteriocin [Laceyella putida]|uniref:Heterocycloanthracin/sonorensin family bacteriocin n=1 Tax=Laceyella putida TaxID=110101 RepID=A0ABW2RHQ9_9BACL
MDDFKKELQKLGVDEEFMQGEVTPWEHQGYYDPALAQQCAGRQCAGRQCFNCTRCSGQCFGRCFGQCFGRCFGQCFGRCFGQCFNCHRCFNCGNCRG